jgi:hypothetical protein
VKTTFLFTSWMHLGDEVLAGAALGHQHDETRAQAHLDECPRCQARLDDLRALLDTQRRDAAALADARFPQTRLDAQRAGILARLAERHAGARVLMFPTAAVTATASPDGALDTPLAPLQSPLFAYAPMLRRTAATLAAGLFIALLGGQTYYTYHVLVTRAAAQQQADRDRFPHIPRHHVRWTAESGPDAVPGDATDDRLLGEIETELARGRRNPALRALDDLTPRAPGTESRSHRYRER